MTGYIVGSFIVIAIVIFWLSGALGRCVEKFWKWRAKGK